MSQSSLAHLPLVTIVTPSYNQAGFIKETIESVLAQDYPRIEYIVIDGGSTDDTVAILERYADRLTWVSERDRGQAHAVNKGWKRATGDILGWLNSDDVYLPGAVSKAVRYLATHHEAGMVYGRALRIAANGSTIDEYPTDAADYRKLMNRCMICQPAAFLRSYVVRDVKYLDESLNYCIDYDLWIRISQKYTMGYIPHVLAKSRLHPDCKTLKERVATHREACETLYRHYGFVSPSWIGGYTREVFKARFVRPTAWRMPLICVGAFAVGIREFVRYNSRLPPSQFWPWAIGLYRGLKKAWRTRERGPIDSQKSREC